MTCVLAYVIFCVPTLSRVLHRLFVKAPQKCPISFVRNADSSYRRQHVGNPTNQTFYPFTSGVSFFCVKIQKSLHISKKSSTFAAEMIKKNVPFFGAFFSVLITILHYQSEECLFRMAVQKYCLELAEVLQICNNRL